MNRCETFQGSLGLRCLSHDGAGKTLGEADDVSVYSPRRQRPALAPLQGGGVAEVHQQALQCTHKADTVRVSKLMQHQSRTKTNCVRRKRDL